MSKKTNEEILAELGVEVTHKERPTYTKKEERIIAGFEEIQRFYDTHKRLPVHDDEGDIFEKLYAVRLRRIKEQAECRDLLLPLDHQGLLENDATVKEPTGEYRTDAELLGELGVEPVAASDVTRLVHVRSYDTKQRASADEVGNRSPCEEFDKFQPLFHKVQQELDSGLRKSERFLKDGSSKIRAGDFFILTGQKAYVADVGDEFIGSDGRKEYRLRVIFDNGVESNQLMRSLQKRLWEDDTARRITGASLGPLFDSVASSGESASGTIYILRSLSTLPLIAENRNVIHKIGVTSGDVSKRIAGASKHATYLLSDVDVVATYELYNLNCQKLEQMLHRFFDNARLKIELTDRFDNVVAPREWFLVPLHVIDEVVEKIKDGSIEQYRYDAAGVKLELIG